MNGSGAGISVKEDDGTAVGRGIINTILIPIIGLIKLNTAGLPAESGISML